MAPSVEKKKHTHLNVLQKLELIIKLEGGSSDVAIHIVPRPNIQQMDFFKQWTTLAPF